MKKLLLSSAIALLSTSAAFAGAVTDPIIAPQPMPAAPAASLWNGFYAGGTVGWNTGNTIPVPPPTVAFDGMTYGGFVGYNYVMDSGLMVGAEAAGSIANMNYAVPPNLVGTLIDVKLRAGMEAGAALFFVSGGYTFATYDNGDQGGGFNVGAGIDYLVTDSIFVGAEYIYRDINDTLVTPSLWEDQSHTIQARVGFKF